MNKTSEHEIHFCEHLQVETGIFQDLAAFLQVVSDHHLAQCIALDGAVKMTVQQVFYSGLLYVSGKKKHIVLI